MALLACKRAGLFEILSDSISSTQCSPALFHTLLPLLVNISKSNEDSATRIAKTILPILLTRSELVTQNPDTVSGTIQLLESLGKYEGLAYTIGQNKDYPEFVGVLEAQVPSGSEMETKLKAWKNVVENDKPQEITVRKVLSIWEKEIVQKQSITLENARVAEHINFVFMEMTVLCDTVMKDPAADNAKELQAGCKCFELLNQEKANNQACMDLEEEATLVAGLRRQKDPTVIRWLVKTAFKACQDEYMAKNFALQPRVKEMLVTLIQDGQKLPASHPEREEVNVERLSLMKAVIPDRKWLNGTKAMSVFIDFWDDWDSDTYTLSIPVLVFQCMRLSVNSEWVDELLARQVPARLVGIVEKPSSSLLLLPNVFFLIGSLAMIKAIKDRLTDLHTVEKVIQFIDRRKADLRAAEPSAPAVTNAMLAMGNLCVGDEKNTNEFKRLKGMEQSMEMMRVALVDGAIQYEIGNAAAVVLCNVSFQRDDVKRDYGSLQAPKTIMDTISQYDGTKSDAAFRCLGSMLKATGNLSLYPPNVKEFCDGGIAKVLGQFLERTGDMPEDLVEAGFRCLANLAMENNEEVLSQFNILMKPFIAAIDNRAGSRNSSISAFALTTLASLFQLEQNAESGVEFEAFAVCGRVVAQHNDARVLLCNTNAIAGAAYHQHLIPAIVAQGGLSVVLEIMKKEMTRDGEQSGEEICAQCFRCIKRFLRNKPTAMIFVNEDGIRTTISLLKSLPHRSTATLEGLKIIFALLNLFPPPRREEIAKNFKDDDDGWDVEPVPSEGFAPIVDAISRPPGPRSWEALNMTPQMLCEIISLLVGIIADDSCWKLKRLMLLVTGLLCYISCEKVQGTIEAFFATDIVNKLANLLTGEVCDFELLDMVTLIAANIALVSEEETFLALKESSIADALHQAETKLPRNAPKSLRRDINDTYALLKGEKSVCSIPP